jgi:hypothetical protein
MWSEIYISAQFNTTLDSKLLKSFCSACDKWPLNKHETRYSSAIYLPQNNFYPPLVCLLKRGEICFCIFTWERRDKSAHPSGGHFCTLLQIYRYTLPCRERNIISILEFLRLQMRRESFIIIFWLQVLFAYNLINLISENWCTKPKSWCYTCTRSCFSHCQFQLQTITS